MTEEWIGLIPAAGKGIRLGLPYPKELYPVIRGNRYKPISQFILDNLVTAGVRHVVFVINETKHQLIGFFGDGHRFHCDISYVVQERREEDRSTSPGLAHALASAQHLVKDKQVFFGMADTIIEPRDAYRKLNEAFEADADLVMGLFPTQSPEKFGMVRMGKGGEVLEIVDKPKETDLQYMWGCMIWRPVFTEFLNQKVRDEGVGDFAAVMNAAINAGLRFRGAVIPGGSYYDLGTYQEIIELDRQFRQE